jgi:hypothetical protein
VLVPTAASAVEDVVPNITASYELVVRNSRALGGRVDLLMDNIVHSALSTGELCSVRAIALILKEGQVFFC